MEAFAAVTDEIADLIGGRGGDDVESSKPEGGMNRKATIDSQLVWARLPISIGAG